MLNALSLWRDDNMRKTVTGKTMSVPAASNKIGLNTSLPSIRRIHSIIREKTEVEIKLTTGDQLRGKISWIDDQCICLDTSGHKVVIWQHAIAFIKN